MSNHDNIIEEYILPHSVVTKALELRSMGRWTIAEIAKKLGVKFADLHHDLDLCWREAAEYDD